SDLEYEEQKQLTLF
ncbi:TPA: hypothetical protein PI228_002863, partial [Staphylococcus aureus]|nr:hypothetical protein [Staphylococcus aureus]